MSSNAVTHKNTVVQDPPLARFLFSDTRMAWFWLVVRVFVGWQWVDASLHKISDPGWTVTGEALKKYWLGAVAIPAPPARPPISFEWYRSFIQFLLDTQSYTWFAKLVAYGELFIGVALIIGAFVGIAAFFGAFMNWNFIMAGSASTNGLLLVLAIGLVMAWKIAGWWGLDRWLLHWLGTPWPGESDSTAPVPVGAPAK